MEVVSKPPCWIARPNLLPGEPEIVYTPQGSLLLSYSGSLDHEVYLHVLSHFTDSKLSKPESRKIPYPPMLIVKGLVNTPIDEAYRPDHDILYAKS